LFLSSFYSFNSWSSRSCQNASCENQWTDFAAAGHSSALMAVLGARRHQSSKLQRNWRLDASGSTGSSSVARVEPQQEAESPARTVPEKVPRKRRFEWMDSSDESSEERDEREEKAEREEDESAEESCQLSDVTTLSQMLRLVPILRRNATTMPPAVFSEILSAAARVRFYDAEFFDKLLPEFRSRLRRPSGFTCAELVDSAVALQELNAYDVVIFSAIVSALRPRVHELDAEKRRKLLATFKASKHKDDEFRTQLVEREQLEAEVRQAHRQSADYLVMRSPGQLRPCRM